jgi:hypothetical protein
VEERGVEALELLARGSQRVARRPSGRIEGRVGERREAVKAVGRADQGS